MSLRVCLSVDPGGCRSRRVPSARVVHISHLHWACLHTSMRRCDDATMPRLTSKSWSLVLGAWARCWCNPQLE